MKKLIQKLAIVLSTTLMLSFASATLISQPAYADAKSDACAGASLVTGSSASSCTPATGKDSVQGIVTTIINILSIVVGAVAVIMLIIGGLRFVLSGGDSNNVNSARNTILYAVVGLVIVGLAQVIVKFVVGKLP